MSWVAITVAEFVLEGFNADERSTLQTAAGGDDGLSGILSAAVAEWRGVIEGAGNDLDADTTKIPPSCRRYIVAQVRWQVLIKFPELQKYQTKERHDAADQAQEVLAKIAEGKWPIEAPTEEATDAPAGGNWNANEKIAMRTDGNRANEA
jgi:hypothetical protein